MIRSPVTLKQLEALVSVVDLGSFRAAAEELGTTQPNISARIAALEEVLGTTLVCRGAGPARATDKGATIVEAARATLLAAEGVLAAADRRDLVVDRLRLGVSELVACTWLHAFLRALKVEYPQVRVELQVNLSAEITRALHLGELDLAFQTAPFEDTLPCQVPLATSPYVWVAAPDVARALPEKPGLKDILGGPVLAHARQTAATIALARAAEALDTSQIAHSNSLISCVPMAVDGLGVALLPEAIVQGPVDEGKLQRVDVSWSPPPLELFARAHDIPTSGVLARAVALAQEITRDQKN